MSAIANEIVAICGDSAGNFCPLLSGNKFETDFDSKCRLCLQPSQERYAVLEMKDIIYYLTSITVTENDNLPSICCGVCKEDLLKVEKIRARIMKCDEILKDVHKDSKLNAKSGNEGMEEVTSNYHLSLEELEAADSKPTNVNYIKTPENTDIFSSCSDISDNKIEIVQTEVAEEFSLNENNIDSETENAFQNLPTKIHKNSNLIPKNLIININGKNLCQNENKQTRTKNVGSKKIKKKMVTHLKQGTDCQFNTNSTKIKTSDIFANSSRMKNMPVQIVKRESNVSDLPDCVNTEVKINNCDPKLETHTMSTDKSNVFDNIHNFYTGRADNPVFKCYNCEKEVIGKMKFYSHLSTHDLSKCKVCGARIPQAGPKSVTKYVRHMNIHFSEPQVCEICGAVAKNMESLRGHMFYMHKSSDKQYKCEECNKFFRYKYKYTLHIKKSHVGERTCICEVCGKGFFTNHAVQTHIQLRHLKMRPWICEYCKRGFSSRYARNTHLRQHTNETPYMCHVCSKGFRQKISLKGHLVSKHGLVNYDETVTNKDPLSIKK